MTTETKTRVAADATERRALLFVFGTGVVLFVMATPLYGLHFSRGIAVGGLLAAFNLWATARTVRSFLAGNAPTDGEVALGASWGVFAIVKFSLLLAGTYLLFRFHWVHGVALIVGLAALPVGIVLLQIAGPSARR